MSINETILERVKAQLRQGKNIGSTMPQDLYSHLTEVFNRILLQHPTDALDRFEEISAMVKQTDLKFKDPKYDFEVNEAEPAREQTDADKWVQKCKSLLQEVLEKQHTGKRFIMPNLQEEAEMLDWAGINFGEETTYLLQQSLKKLAVMSGADSISFCGKIYGTNNDYWIASGRMDRAEEDVKDINFEQRGKGVNRLVYWVSTNLLSDWVQLPDAKPEHVVAARKIKHVFTGDLNASFSTNPAFPGKERHLLRAQLARIFHATSIVPAGLFEIDEETQQLKYAEEYEFPSTTDLNDPEKWVNLNPQILKIGRTSHVYDDETIPEEWSDEQKEAYAAMKESDQPTDAFRPITEHTKMPDQGKKQNAEGDEDQGLPSWTFKIVGDKQVYNMADDKTACYAVNVIRSLRWPGAITVSKGGKYLNFYLGFGMKRNDSSYQPTEPPEVQADPDEADMQDEPTPKEAPEELPEEDTDKEEEKEEDE